MIKLTRNPSKEYGNVHCWDVEGQPDVRLQAERKWLPSYEQNRAGTVRTVYTVVVNGIRQENYCYRRETIVKQMTAVTGIVALGRWMSTW